MARKAYYNRTNTCDECKINKLSPHKAKREVKNDRWTGRWLCLECHGLIMNYGTTDENRIAIIRSEYQYEKAKKFLENRKYNDGNICEECKENLIVENARREYDIKGNWTGRWLCVNCYGRIREKWPGSRSNIMKYLADSRTGNLDPKCSKAKGDLFQELTCIWRSTVSTIPVEDLNKKLDNYNTPIDHSRDSELGILQTMGRLYNPINKTWKFSWSEGDYENKDYDNVICYCTDEKEEIIEKAYVFPKSEMIIRKGITINKYILKGPHWYEKYRITNEEDVENINDIWKKIIEDKNI